MTQPDSAQGSAQRFVFLMWLRAAAVWLVIWSHFAETFTRVHGIAFPPLQAYVTFVSAPLKLDSGQFGVLIFFVVSGFIITHVAMRETRTEFAVRRFFRIYPPVLLSVLLYATIVYLLRASSLPSEESGEISASNLAATILLFPFITESFQPFLPILWTLSIELLFYGVIFVMMGQLKNRPRLAALLPVAGMFLITETAPHGGVFARPLTLLAALTPLFTGQAIYLGWSKRVRPLVATACVCGLWVAAERSLQTDPSAMQYAATNAVSTWRALAYLLFAVCLLGEDRLRPYRLIAFSADISYSLYLLHLPVGYLSLGVLTPRIGYTPALVVAVAATVGASALSFKYVEEPCRRYARSLWRRTPSAPLTTVASSGDAPVVAAVSPADSAPVS